MIRHHWLYDEAMREKGIIQLALLVLIGALIIAGAVALMSRERSGDAVGNFAAQEGNEKALEGSLAAEVEILKAQLERARESGGIHPDNKAGIEESIEGLRARGASTEDLALLENLLARIPVGGAEAPKAPPVAPTTPRSSGEKAVKQESAPAPAPPTVVAPPPPAPSCVSNVNPVFTQAVADPVNISGILPPPNRPKTDLSVLKTHSYINSNNTALPVYAPVDMEFIKGAHYVGGPYSLDFRVSCEVTIRLAHITNPVAKIANALPAEPVTDSRDVSPPVPVLLKAGELVGYIGGPPHTLAVGFDFGVYNSATPNRFASDPTYTISTIYTTAVCPFDYFTPELRDAYRAKYYLSAHEGMQYDLPHFCK